MKFQQADILFALNFYHTHRKEPSMSGTLPPPPPVVGFILEYRLEDLRNKHGATINIFTSHELKIGKAPDSNIYVHDPQIESLHAILRFVAEEDKIGLQLVKPTSNVRLQINDTPMVSIYEAVGPGDHIKLGYGATLKLVSIRKGSDKGHDPKLRHTHLIAREEITAERTRLLAELSSLSARQHVIIMRLSDLQPEDTMLENQINGALRNPQN